MQRTSMNERKVWRGEGAEGLEIREEGLKYSDEEEQEA